MYALPVYLLPTCLPAHYIKVYNKDFQGQKGWFLQTCANHVLKYKNCITANMKWADDDDVGGHVKFLIIIQIYFLIRLIPLKNWVTWLLRIHLLHEKKIQISYQPVLIIIIKKKFDVIFLACLAILQKKLLFIFISQKKTW